MTVMTLSTPGLGSMAWPTVMMLVSMAAPASPFMSSHCYFNPLCTCKLQAASPGQGLHNITEPASPLNAIQSLMQAPVDIRDVSCLGVPFARIPGTFWLSPKNCLINLHHTIENMGHACHVTRTSVLEIKDNCFLGLLILEQCICIWKAACFCLLRLHSV